MQLSLQSRVSGSKGLRQGSEPVAEEVRGFLAQPPGGRATFVRLRLGGRHMDCDCEAEDGRVNGKDFRLFGRLGAYAFKRLRSTEGAWKLEHGGSQEIIRRTRG